MMRWLFPRGNTSRQRFQIAFQRTRASAYAVAALVAAFFGGIDIVRLSVAMIALIAAVAILSALLLARLVVYAGPSGLGIWHNWLWLTLDGVLITWGVHLTGGFLSPWFPWYLATISGAAFIIGQWGAVAVTVLDTTLYAGLLVLLGEVKLGDDYFFIAVARVVFLYGASFVFLRGTSMLRRKRMQVEALHRDEALQLKEMTRLTAALDQRTSELEAANARIREADRMKSQFLATMSHELRTPLNSIIGFSDILQAKLASDINDRYLKFLANINVSGRHLLAVINNILDLSKVEAGRMELTVETVDLDMVLEGVKAIMLPTARERGISISTSWEGDVRQLEADPVKLKQILFNLLANAVKFSHDNGSVRVTVRPIHWGRGREEALEIEVRDDGVGIDPRHHRVIFEEFRQADGSSTRAHGGTGLGLALVRRLVSLHAGTVEVQSSLGEGATFTVTLPVAFHGDAERRGESSDDGLRLDGGGGTRVLVVEDDPTAYEVLANLLTEAGYLTVRARSGEEALEQARRIRPAAITLDVILPEVDGWETLQQLKADESTRNIPVIMVSMVRNHELALALGAEEYFTKPVDGEALVRRLATIVPLSRARNGKILLIDDDPHLHELVDEHLGGRGFSMLHASTGAEGLEKAAGEEPDLVLLDLMMDGMDGFEVAARLKDDPATRGIPIVVITAKDMTARDRVRLQGRIEDLLEKFDLQTERLVEVVGRVLEYRGRT
jgi:signal transduction histidine kinase/DNA-binding response OmpR family regulator